MRRKVLEYTLDELQSRVQRLEEDHKDDTVLMLVLYEALYVIVSNPGNAFAAFKQASDILAMLGEPPKPETVEG